MNNIDLINHLVSTLNPRSITQQIKKQYPNLYAEIIANTLHLDSKATKVPFKSRIFHYINPTYHITPPTCMNCNAVISTYTKALMWNTYCSSLCRGSHNSSKSREKAKETSQTNWGVDNPTQHASVREKMQNTTLEKHGVKFALQSDKIQLQKTNTNLERYGVEHASQHNNIKQKTKDTNLERYGVDNPMKDIATKEKLKATNLSRHGVEWTLQSTDIILRRKETNLSRYGVEHTSQKHIPTESYDKLADVEWLTDEIDNKTAIQIASELSVSVTKIYKTCARAGIELPNHRSNFELEVVEFIKSLSISNIQQNNRKILNGKEIDIFLPDYNIAIECNGSYWHSELQGRDKLYHLNKTNACQEQGIHLIHIWSHTWNDKQELVKSRIRSKLGINDRIYARKTQIQNVSTYDAVQFLDANHIQGACIASVRYGLYYDNALVALMTFGKSRYDKKIQWELIRYCSKQNINVVGGASKIFKHFLRNHTVSAIISYSDRMWNTGGLYESLGFTYSHTTRPSYYYTKNYAQFENRVAYQKHKLKDKLGVFDANLTEWQNMKANGFDRIFDCGNQIFKFFS